MKITPCDMTFHNENISGPYKSKYLSALNHRQCAQIKLEIFTDPIENIYGYPSLRGAFPTRTNIQIIRRVWYQQPKSTWRIIFPQEKKTSETNHMNQSHTRETFECSRSQKIRESMLRIKCVSDNLKYWMNANRSSRVNRTSTLNRTQTTIMDWPVNFWSPLTTSRHQPLQWREEKDWNRHLMKAKK